MHVEIIILRLVIVLTENISPSEKAHVNKLTIHEKFKCVIYAFIRSLPSHVSCSAKIMFHFKKVYIIIAIQKIIKYKAQKVKVPDRQKRLI